MQFAVHDEDATPDDVAWFGNAFDGPATKAEIHWRLPFARRAFEAADEMGGRRRAGDEEDPDVIVHSIVSVMLAPAEIVKRVLRRKTEFTPETIGDEAVQTG